MAHILYNLCKGKFCVMRMSIAFCLYYFLIQRDSSGSPKFQLKQMLVPLTYISQFYGPTTAEFTHPCDRYRLLLRYTFKSKVWCRARTCAVVNVCTHEHTPGRALAPHGGLLA